MSRAQRYVSSELTHFVGRRKRSQRAQYEVIRAILKSRWLAHDPLNPGAFHTVDIWPGTKLSDGKMFKRKAICFCDIPVDDLQLHMKKYSKFGISFLKTFLIRQGASPVYYFANDSKIQLWAGPDGKRRPAEFKTRARVLDEVADEFFALWYDLRVWGRGGRHEQGYPPRHILPQDLHPAVADHLRASQRVDDFLMHYLMAYVKGFRVRHPDEHSRNYYMEREWRAIQDVRFKLSDVWRVILPMEFSRQFKRDFPQFAGQLTFSDK